MLDLVAFIYRKVFFEMGMPLVRNEGMREFSNDFELYLIATFRKQDEALGLDFCKKLTELCTARNKNMFQLEVRFTSGEEAGGQKFYTESAIKSKLAELQSETKEKELKRKRRQKEIHDKMAKKLKAL